MMIDQACHVFDLLGNARRFLSVLGRVRRFEVREEEHDVADDGHRRHHVEGDGDELGTGSCAHGV